MNKIGMYTDDEILNFMTEGEGRGFLGRSVYDAIRETIEEKDKEIERLNNKLNAIRKYLKDNEREKEIERLKARKEEITQKYLSATKYASEKEDENIRLNNIIDELDNLISIKIVREANEFDYHIDINDMVEIKLKLKELKEGK